ncbi:diacylglycerol acyltransferase/mycolyltransferase Ag85A [Mycolicibacterium acapulense]|uniref:alpha/beta hydrolase n=1 Tax=Mycobacterium sp. 852014-52144_SCH5372336 TaxID=1834115 RepID=UPI0007477592|nr:alpha/beta hydrolase family protein [Mycobacterium sp. 852014-52144_SCH5372336]KUI08735.1 diacylglycerol acyltransferase/mycolyltransferase Ag85A [Mycolicibacterium acapulense]OBB75105.1 diacylglycerol acyltransferase/mycolyltransferase Ag85A [Mycobacterium sp. 852014-52144_SCH5372336]
MDRPVRTWLRRVLAAAAAAVALPSGAAAVGAAAPASAFSREGLPVEYLDVYSPSMGRIVRVQFQPAGTELGDQKAVYLLDGMRARDDYNGWDIETAAFEWFFESGVATVMPVGGEASFYADWYTPSSYNSQPYTYKWETFLTDELPAWLAANKDVSTTGNAVVGVSMSGSAALILSAHHPHQFAYAASLSGPLNPSAPSMQQAIRVAMLDAGGYSVDNMWGAPWDGAWKRHDPVHQAARLAANNTRLWIHCAPSGSAPREADTDPNQTFDARSLESMTLKSSKDFQTAYLTAGGNNATFEFPPQGNHAWPDWGAQLQTLKPDLVTTLRGGAA